MKFSFASLDLQQLFRSEKKDLNTSLKSGVICIASGKRPDGFLVFPPGYTPEVKGWLVWLLEGERCNGVRPFL
jgi:hypothetical protein